MRKVINRLKVPVLFQIKNSTAIIREESLERLAATQQK